MRNIQHACFTTVGSSINDTFKVSNNLTIQGWHAGIGVMYVLNQLSELYGHQTLAMMETNNKVFIALIWLPILPRSCFAALKNAPILTSLGKTCPQIVNLLTA
jgi:hypothetical protein